VKRRIKNTTAFKKIEAGLRDAIAHAKGRRRLTMREIERREVAQGIAQADRGELIPVTDDLIARIMSRGRARLAAKTGKTN